jgi:hypothetical protein
MAYDEHLATRIELAVAGWPGVSTERMFGSIGWMLKGNICVGIWKDSLIVRCGPVEWPKLIQQPHVAEFDITGRSMKGWLLVRPPGIASPSALGEWLQRAHDFVRTLPAKGTKTKAKPRGDKLTKKPARSR